MNSSSLVALVEEVKVERHQVIVIVAVHDVVAAAMIVLAVMETIESLR